MDWSRVMGGVWVDDEQPEILSRNVVVLHQNYDADTFADPGVTKVAYISKDLCPFFMSSA